MTGELLRMRGIVKRFPGVRALDGVDLDVSAGEVHCLLGQNGAGKSTLIKVLCGVHQADAGELEWSGRPVRPGNPMAAMRIGLAAIYQELDLVDGLNVAENIFLGHEPATAGFSRRTRMHAEAAALLTRLGHDEISTRTEVGRLSAAGKQIVSIARALSHDVRLLVMDEPSAVLDAQEVRRLFRVVSELTDQGVAIIYISHRMEEIRAIGDRVTVLKDGRTVAAGLPAGTTPTGELTRKMTGRPLEHAFGETRRGSSNTRVALRVRGLGVPGLFSDIDFQVRAGEVYGIAGLVGSGRSEILETIFGARRPDRGGIEVAGQPIRPNSVRAAVAAGVGLCPEERKSQALLADEPVATNISLATLTRFARSGFLDRTSERRAAQKVADRIELRPPDIHRRVQTLSGGNQQKVVLARWLLRDCRVLLLDEPTRGVDVGARTEIYRLIRQLADDGVAVVLVSSELPEVLGLADRVLVVADGRAVHEDAAADLDEHRVLDLVMEGTAA